MATLAITAKAPPIQDSRTAGQLWALKRIACNRARALVGLQSEVAGIWHTRQLHQGSKQSPRRPLALRLALLYYCPHLPGRADRRQSGSPSDRARRAWEGSSMQSSRLPIRNGHRPTALTPRAG